MSYIILRSKKFHHLSELAKVGRHNGRLASVQNADAARAETNIVFVPQSGELSECVRSKLHGVRIRKNAVIACEVIMTCSAGALLPDVYRRWLNVCMNFARDKFGSDNIVQAVGHMDEKAPHLHVTFVPFVNGRLNCRALFGGPEKMRKLQDEFYEKCGKSFGLQRGIRNSGTKHIPMKDLYQMTEHFEGVKVPLPPEPPSVALGKAKKDYQESVRAELQAEIDKQTAALKEAAERTRLAELKAKQTALRNSMLASKAKTLEADLKAERNRLRDLPLNDVARALGYEGKKEGAEYTRYVTQLGDLVIHSENKFFVNGTEKGGKGAINLVMLLEGLDFKNAVALLRDKFGSQVVVPAAMKHFEADVVPTLMSSKLNPAPKLLDTVDENRIHTVRTYLVETRHLPAAMVDALIAIGDIAANRFGAVLFHMRNEFGVIKGQIIRATTTAYKGIRKLADCWFRWGAELKDAKRAIVVESPIDALSYPAKEGDAILSFGGANPSTSALKKALGLLRRDCEVIAAFDNDTAGQNGNQRIIEIAREHGRATKTETPELKDWNEDCGNSNSQKI